MSTYYESRVVSVGPDAADMIAGGVTILFGTPCPDALAEISVVHEVVRCEPERLPQPGDTLRLGESVVTVTRVGDRAGENLRTLGHVVIYSDVPQGDDLLPGAIHAAGQLAVPRAGDRIELSSVAA